HLRVGGAEASSEPNTSFKRRRPSSGVSSWSATRGRAFAIFMSVNAQAHIFVVADQWPQARKSGQVRVNQGRSLKLPNLVHCLWASCDRSELSLHQNSLAQGAPLSDILLR